jgi:predicted N-acyltransferase
MIAKELWERNRPKTNPFLNYEFMNALIQSGCIGGESGWTPTFIQDDGILMSFMKTHSYGEYIFDWGWAEAYERNGLNYYPKLTSLIPFTPVTTQHFLMKDFDHEKARSLLKKHDEYLQKGPFSSSHFLFLTPEEMSVFENEGYMIRESMQYHFFNEEFKSFDDFLSTLKTKKAKNIRQERMHSDLEIKTYTGSALTKDHAHQMYQFYLSTIVNKNSYDYLNEAFFHFIFSTLQENILYVEASQNDSPVGGSLFFFDDEKLYGRYWGSSSYIENLHFELCYYQGIDFAIEKKLKVFEAGAQGEHKIARGFRPIRTYSAHKIKHPVFQDAISHFIKAEKEKVAFQLEELSKGLPFKDNP